MTTDDGFNGCPCGRYGPCCANPEPVDAHKHFCLCDNDHCDYHWYRHCNNCGDECGCDV